MKHSSHLFFISAALILLAACSGGGSDNGLSQTYPTDLVVTSPYAAQDAVEGLTKLSPRLQQQQISQDPITPPDYVQQKKVIQDRISSGTLDDCKFTLALFRKKTDVTCYGPQVAYQNHPDGPGGSGTLPSGDVGIWNETEASSGQPCVVAKIDSITSEAQAFIQTAQDLFSSMLCVAKVKGLDALPAIGASVDLKDALNELKSSALPITISTGTIERLADADGKPLYQSQILGQIDGGNLGTVNVTVHLRHIPTTADNSTYKGRMWFTFGGPGVTQPDSHCSGNGSQSESVAGSVGYEKTSSTNINYQFRRAQYCDEAQADPFDTDHNLDSSNKYDSGTTPGGWASNFTDFRANFDPSNLSGTFSTAWQAGTMDSNTRAFLAELKEASSTLSGCGYYGFGPDISATDAGKISGMICNWAGPGSSHSILPKVQRQCVSYNTTSNKWESEASTLNISYAPVNNTCEINNTPGVPSGTAQFDGQTVIANDLLDFASMPLSPPTPPSGI